jgi:nucleoside 2-deoxyribosyltransferase
MNDSTCPVCLEDGAEIQPPGSKDLYRIACQRCGRFSVSGSSHSQFMDTVLESSSNGQLRLGPGRSRRRANASAWVRTQGADAEMLNSKDVPRLAALPSPSVLERCDRLLLALADRTESVGEDHDIAHPRWTAYSWSVDAAEALKVAKLLGSQTWLEFGKLEAHCRPVHITFAGWQRVRELQSTRSPSEQGFVAMWFASEMQSAYNEAIAPAVETAGFRPHRVDLGEYEGRIDDEIIAQIRRSRFMVADFTGHRGGVYYEAGFGHGLGLPVFFTCKKDPEKDLDLHFDVRQYNTIVWTDHDDLRTRLKNRIEAVLGRGPLAEE